MRHLPVAAPPYNPEAEPFWTAAADGRLVLPRCDDCQQYIWYPRAFCPMCGADAVTWTELSGRGTVYAVTVLRKAMGPWASAAPFPVAYVELDEGPRLLTTVITDEPEGVCIGDQVTATFLPLPDLPDDAPAQAIVRFAPS